MRDQLIGRGEIDAVKAWISNRRTRYAQVDFLRAGATQGAHLRARRRAADDRIIDNDHALAVDQFTDDVQLEIDGHVALKLRGQDERSTDEAIGDDPFF